LILLKKILIYIYISITDLYSLYLGITYYTLSTSPSYITLYTREQCRAIAQRAGRRRRRGARRNEQILIPEKISWAERREEELGGQGKKAILAEWRADWAKEQETITSWLESIAALGRPEYQSLKLYDQSRKAESSVLFQARTGRIGLRKFLASARIPGIESGACLCGTGLETAEHTLLHCIDQPRGSWAPEAQFSQLVSEPGSGAAVARWIIRSGKLGQYHLADRLLYKAGNEIEGDQFEGDSRGR
jgi:hypothetical protein